MYRSTPTLLHFNPRSREGSDSSSVQTIVSELDFNPRSREGSDHKFLASAIPLYDFNPRSREGSDFHGLAQRRSAGISIHAPVKGATWTSI